MIDLKTIKEIRIAEGSVKKITNSSGVVLWQKVVAPSSSLDVDLNNQWVDSTKTLDGYKVYMSNSNHNVDNGYASMKFKFKGQPNFKLWINSYAESIYDYTIAWNMDVNYPTSNPSYNSTGVKAHTRGNQKDPTSISNFTEVDYSNDGGEHFVVVTYRKDFSGTYNDDRGYVAIKLTLISTSWVVSATEFIKKDGKYYEKLTEVETYEGGVTALTGNYKEGNELTVTYHQGSADDYMVVGSGRYYKKYAYVTPKDQEINTGDYIQGDYIGEVTPSMKVTYTDGSEKTFYNLTSIEKNTDANINNAKEIVIGDSIIKIGHQAFYACTNLTDVTLSNSLVTIDFGAFFGCSNLTGIRLPESVTSIGEYAFGLCSSITSITIPTNVTEIGKNTFNQCSKLTEITFKATTPPTLDSTAFSDSGIQTIYVPAASLDAYKSATNWSAFASKIKAILSTSSGGSTHYYGGNPLG